MFIKGCTVIDVNDSESRTIVKNDSESSTIVKDNSEGQGKKDDDRLGLFLKGSTVMDVDVA